MAETNGAGRMDRIEAALDRLEKSQEAFDVKFHLMVEHHEAEFKTLMTWQVLMQDKMDRADALQRVEQQRLNELSANTDKRIADLVLAIGKLIESQSGK